MNAKTTFQSAAAIITLAAVLSGCSSSSSQISTHRQAKQIRGNLTPQLKTLSQRYVDVENDWAIIVNENMRMAREDWRRIWLTNRPSRLTVMPMPR